MAAGTEAFEPLEEREDTTLPKHRLIVGAVGTDHVILYYESAGFDIGNGCVAASKSLDVLRLGPTPSMVGAAFAGVAVYDGPCVGGDKDPLREVEAFRDAIRDLSLWEHTKGFAPR
jgi:hypothetical protein